MVLFLLAINFVLDNYFAWQAKNGGPLEIEHVVYSKGRGNLIVKYAGHANLRASTLSLSTPGQDKGSLG